VRLIYPVIRAKRLQSDWPQNKAPPIIAFFFVTLWLCVEMLALN
jgi:hypothetical protein